VSEISSGLGKKYKNTLFRKLIYCFYPCKLVPEHSGALNLFLKFQNCPKFALPHQTPYNRVKIYIVSEVSRSLGNFGHQGFFKKNGTRGLNHRVLMV